MKEYIDFQATLQAELSAKLRLASRLKRMWGTHLDNGVEVYNETFQIWPGTESEGVKQVLKLLNIPYADIANQSKDGLTSLYLRFNPDKTDTSSYSREALATILETEIPLGENREFQYTHTDPSDPSKFVGWTAQEIAAYVTANVSAVTTSGITSTQDLTDDNIDSFIGPYLIAEAGVDFSKELVSATVAAVSGTVAENGKTENYISGIQLRYKYKRTGYLDDNSPIVVDMYNDLMVSAEEQDAATRSVNLRRYLGRFREGKTDTLWYNGKIRTESSRLLKKHDYTNLIFGSLDTGFTQKKSKGWLKILAIVIVIVVTVLTWNPGAGLAAGGALTATQVLTAVAVTAGAVTLALTVYSMILTKYGEAGSAAYVGRWIKVSGFVSMVAGVMSVFANLMKAMAAEAVKEGAATAAVNGTEAAAMSNAIELGNGMVVDMSNITAQNMIDGASNMFMQSFESSTWLSKLSTASKVANMGMEWRQQNLQKELVSMSDECKKQQAALAEEYDKNLHIGLEDIKTYTKPLTTANVQFETDYLYEPTKFNVCRTSFVRTGMNEIVKV